MKNYTVCPVPFIPFFNPEHIVLIEYNSLHRAINAYTGVKATHLAACPGFNDYCIIAILKIVIIWLLVINLVAVHVMHPIVGSSNSLEITGDHEAIRIYHLKSNAVIACHDHLIQWLCSRFVLIYPCQKIIPSGAAGNIVRIAVAVQIEDGECKSQIVTGIQRNVSRSIEFTCSMSQIDLEPLICTIWNHKVHFLVAIDVSSHQIISFSRYCESGIIKTPRTSP